MDSPNKVKLVMFVQKSPELDSVWEDRLLHFGAERF